MQNPAWREAHERLKGRDPRELSVEDFAGLGFGKRPLLAVIRENRIGCQGGSEAEVRRCAATTCVFWPYRMNHDPFRAQMPEEQRQAAAARLARVRAATLKS